MVKIKIISENKGSNPGSECIYTAEKESFEGYIKYCPGTALPRNFPFNPQNQPIYEAFTSEMAKYLGLKLPQTFVLFGKNGLEFEIDTSKRKQPWDEKRKCYFLSRKVYCSEEGDIETGEKLIKEQEIYLELLKISDIIGRKQNWLYCPSVGGLFYLDVGCGIIQAHNGRIGMKSECIKYLKSDDRLFKEARRNLRRYYLSLCDDKDLVCVEEILELPYKLYIPTKNPCGKSKLEELLTEEELKGIVKILTLNMQARIKELERINPNKIIRC